MDLTQITELRAWAARLEERSESDDELRAAARAIRILVDEVESLQARLVVAEAAPPPASEAPSPLADAPPPAAPSRRVARPSLLDRLKRTFGFE